MAGMRVSRKVAIATALSVSIVGSILVSLASNTSEPSPSALASVKPQQPPEPPAALEPKKFELLTGVEQGWVQVAFKGDGLDLVFARIQNLLPEPIQVVIPEGSVLETEEGSVIENQITIVRRVVVEIPPIGMADERLYSAATNSGNRLGEYNFSLTRTRLPLVEPLLHHLVQNPAFSKGAVQTAVLAITENLPMSAFAKFTLASDTAPSLMETSLFRVEVRDLLSALQLLRDAGYEEDRLALAVDPQLKIEAMCDRLTHEAAMNYYGITREQEWQFWHDELLKGDPSTRHYALYGIARYFPEVAVDMMPKWARSARLNSVFRVSSVIAIAETRRPEALSVLAQLNYEFNGTPEMKRATEEATRYLENYVNPPDRRPADIEWRLVQTMKMLTGGQ